MSERTIYVTATRAEVRRAISLIPETAMGGSDLANQMMTRCGITALGRIRDAFITKSRGGTDEAGDKWKPLSPKTIAYSRRHPRLPKKSARAASRPSYALTSKQRERWWDVYKQQLAATKGNKAHAARMAWAVLKREGAQTLLGRYGNTQVDILRDTGLLLNSLSPGVDKSARHNVRSRAAQVFRIGRGEVIVGTNRKGARKHHEGSKDGRIPQRRLWPSPNKWPSSWWLDIVEQGRQGLIDIAIYLIRGAGRQ